MSFQWINTGRNIPDIQYLDVPYSWTIEGEEAMLYKNNFCLISGERLLEIREAVRDAFDLSDRKHQVPGAGDA